MEPHLEEHVLTIKEAIPTGSVQELFSRLQESIPPELFDPDNTTIITTVTCG